MYCLFYIYIYILYTKMNVCMYLIKIQISEPIGTKLCTHLPRGLEETVGYVWAHNISPFPTFSTYFFASGCRFVRSTWLPAPHCPATALYPPCGERCCDVTDVTCTVGCAMKTRRSERNACVWKWKPDETWREWLMNWTCNCIAFIQMITYNLSNLR